MLILTRKLGEKITIGDEITIDVEHHPDVPVWDVAMVIWGPDGAGDYLDGTFPGGGLCAPDPDYCTTFTYTTIKAGPHYLHFLYSSGEKTGWYNLTVDVVTPPP